jgi:hypothetical protein
MCLRDTTLHHMTFATRCLDHVLVTGGYYGNVRGRYEGLRCVQQSGVRGVIEVTVISDQIGGRASGSNC